MTIREYDNDGTIPQGYCMLIYSKPNFGKTHAFGTFPGKVKLIITEPKDPRSVLSWAENISYIETDDPEEYLPILIDYEKQAKAGTLDAQCIGFDSLSFLMSEFKVKFEDEHSSRLSEVEKKKLFIFDKFSMGDDTLRGWGGLASLMKRVTGALNRISKYGIVTIATATEMENPKFNIALDYSPSFMGKEYPNVCNSYFHLVGRVTEPWKLKEDGSIKTPAVSFVSDDGTYMSRVTGKLAQKGSRMPLDYAKILEVLRG
jgi:hypothetical protein